MDIDLRLVADLSSNMKFFAFLLAIVGAASAGLLPATLLPKVNIAPTQVNVVRQPITVTQPELVYRNVPVPVRAVAYTAPAIAAPAISAYAAPAISTYAAPAISTYAAPAISGYAAVSAHGLAVPSVAHAPLTTVW